MPMFPPLNDRKIKGIHYRCYADGKDDENGKRKPKEVKAYFYDASCNPAWRPKAARLKAMKKIEEAVKRDQALYDNTQARGNVAYKDIPADYVPHVVAPTRR